MPVSVPTPDQLKAIAAEMGLALTDADIDSFITLMKPSIEGYNVVDSLPNNLPPVTYPRTPGHPAGSRGEHAQRLVRQEHGPGRARGEAEGQDRSC